MRSLTPRSVVMMLGLLMWTPLSADQARATVGGSGDMTMDIPVSGVLSIEDVAGTWRLDGTGLRLASPSEDAPSIALPESMHKAVHVGNSVWSVGAQGVYETNLVSRTVVLQAPGADDVVIAEGQVLVRRSQSLYAVGTDVALVHLTPGSMVAGALAGLAVADASGVRLVDPVTGEVLETRMMDARAVAWGEGVLWVTGSSGTVALDPLDLSEHTRVDVFGHHLETVQNTVQVHEGDRVHVVGLDGWKSVRRADG